VDIKLRSFDSITVCGMKGTGKTWLEKYGLLPHYETVFVFDTNGEFPEYPSYEPETDSPRELDKVAKVIWEKRNCLLLVSEAELYLPVNGTLPPNVFKIITRGRHRNVGLIADTRRIANLNKTVFGLSEHAFIFRHFSPTDLEYLSKFIPQDVRQLASLPDYHFWHYSRGKVEVCSPIIIPSKRADTPTKVQEERRASTASNSKALKKGVDKPPSQTRGD
jgi:DNA helicase HerA-like ATPase